eukprot:scaffold152340_cov65-Attheya_sp.AAC.2
MRATMYSNLDSSLPPMSQSLVFVGGLRCLVSSPLPVLVVVKLGGPGTKSNKSVVVVVVFSTEQMKMSSLARVVGEDFPPFASQLVLAICT